MSVAAATLSDLDCDPHILDLRAPPHGNRELEFLLRRILRWVYLANVGLIVDAEDLDHQTAQQTGRLLSKVLEKSAATIISIGDALPNGFGLTPVTFTLARPLPSELANVWSAAFKQSERQVSENTIARLSDTFALSEAEIMSIAASDVLSSEDALWEASKMQVRGGLSVHATRISSNADWDSLVIPPNTEKQLRTMVERISQRSQVTQNWGFSSDKGSEGHAALFAGPSGTGKTLAAEVIANSLGHDLYRVDLTSMVSKFAGETENNLRNIFDAAEKGGVVLLFDEADALFGKHHARESHDRHANIEVSFLLQRIELFRGLVILTTNLRSDIDASIQRRFRFILDFPVSDLEQRELIWRRMIPAEAPLVGFEPNRLAKVAMTHDQIRTAALGAAYLAAAVGQPIRQEHLKEAVRSELAKTGQAIDIDDL